MYLLNLFLFITFSLCLVSPNPTFQFYPQQGQPNCQRNQPLNIPLTIQNTAQTQNNQIPINQLIANNQRPTCNKCHKPIVNNINNNQNVIAERNQPILPCNIQPNGVQETNDFSRRLANQVVGNPVLKAVTNQSPQLGVVNPNQSQQPSPHVVNNYFIIPTDVLINETRKIEENNRKIPCPCKKQNKPIEIQQKPQINQQPVVFNQNDIYRQLLQGLLPQHSNYNRQCQRTYNDCENARLNRHVPQNYVHDKPNCKQQNESKQKTDLTSAVPEKLGTPLDHVEENLLAKENRVTRNPTDEAFIRDVKTKFPKMPERVIRDMLFEMKKHLQMPPFNNYYYPHHCGPYNHCMPRHQVNNMPNQRQHEQRPAQNRKGNRKNNKRRKQRKNTGSKEQRGNEDTTTISNTVTSQETTTENFINKEKLVIQDIKYKDKEVHTYEIEETTPYYWLRELGAEDVLPNIYENKIVEDYYPDFTRDNKAHSLYYDVDENCEPNRDARKADSKKKNMTKNGKEKYSKHKLANVKESEEIKYQTPPLLESPDFKTVKVNNNNRNSLRPTYKEDNVNTETTTEKTPTNKIAKKKKDDSNKRTRKAKQNNIETVYANSKIVKYGVQSANSENVEDTASYSTEEPNLISKDGNKTVVLAKSVKHNVD